MVSGKSDLTPKYPERTYSVALIKDGTYAVEVTVDNEAPLMISGFKNEQEAQKWIERESAAKDDDVQF